MIGYRLLPPAEEEMTEAALFYEQARPGFGDIFFDDVQHAIDTVRERPMIGEEIAHGFRRTVVPGLSTDSLDGNGRPQDLAGARQEAARASPSDDSKPPVHRRRNAVFV